jgi:hypothetical protein
MSKIKFLTLIFLLFSSVLFISCDDEPVDPAFTSDRTNNGGGGNDGGVNNAFSVNATKDGVLKQWTLGEASYIKSADIMTIIGVDVSASITIVLNKAKKPGVNPFEFTTYCTYFENEVFYSSYYSNDNNSTGNITVTEFNETNKTIKGTFNFIGKDDDLKVSKVFTKGEFSVKYTEQ